MLMHRLVLGFSAIDVVLSAGDFLFTLVDLEDGLLQLRLQLRNFKGGERLPFFDNVTDVDVDGAHVSGNLGMHIYHLVRLELAGEREHVGDAAALCRCDARSR